MSAPPSVVLDGARLEGLELILDGLLGDTTGYCLPGEQLDGYALAPALEVHTPISPGDRVELEDPDRTPIAILEVERSRPSDEGGWWVAGKVTALRRPEHGHARALRISADTDFTGRLVALFGGDVRAADVLSAVRATSDGRIDLVYVGPSDGVATVSALRDLADTAMQLPGARVLFLPDADVGISVDVATVVARRLGAAEPLDFRRDDRPGTGAVVLFTGLSGAGKSTLARGLVEYLRERTTQPAVLLDGDDVRREIAGELGFGSDDRDRNLRRIAWVAARIAEVGGLAVCAPIAPFAASRRAMRAKVEPRSPFIIVYVATPLEVAESRDRKGLYAKARAGLIAEFTGVDSPYEAPTDADLVIDTSRSTVEDCVAKTVRLLEERGVLPPTAVAKGGCDA